MSFRGFIDKSLFSNRSEALQHSFQQHPPPPTSGVYHLLERVGFSCLHAVDAEKSETVIELYLYGGGGKIWKFVKQKKTKSTLLASNTQGLMTTKQTKPRPVASAALHPITTVYVTICIGGGGGWSKTLTYPALSTLATLYAPVFYNNVQFSSAQFIMPMNFVEHLTFYYDKYIWFQ